MATWRLALLLVLFVVGNAVRTSMTLSAGGARHGSHATGPMLGEGAASVIDEVAARGTLMMHCAGSDVLSSVMSSRTQTFHMTSFTLLPSTTYRSFDGSFYHQGRNDCYLFDAAQCEVAGAAVSMEQMYSSWRSNPLSRYGEHSSKLWFQLFTLRGTLGWWVAKDNNLTEAPAGLHDGQELLRDLRETLPFWKGPINEVLANCPLRSLVGVAIGGASATEQPNRLSGICMQRLVVRRAERLVGRPIGMVRMRGAADMARAADRTKESEQRFKRLLETDGCFDPPATVTDLEVPMADFKSLKEKQRALLLTALANAHDADTKQMLAFLHRVRRDEGPRGFLERAEAVMNRDKFYYGDAIAEALVELLATIKWNAADFFEEVLSVLQRPGAHKKAVRAFESMDDYTPEHVGKLLQLQRAPGASDLLKESIPLVLAGLLSPGKRASPGQAHASERASSVSMVVGAITTSMVEDQVCGHESADGNTWHDHCRAFEARALALGRMGAHRELTELLNNSSAPTRRAPLLLAILELEPSAPMSSDWATAAVELLGNEKANAKHRMTSVLALSTFRSLGEGYLSRVQTMLSHQAADVREAAMLVVSSHRGFASRRATEVAALLRSEDPGVRCSALQALSNFDPSVHAALANQAAALLEDPVAEVRVRALQACYAMRGALGADAVLKVVQLLSDVEEEVMLNDKRGSKQHVGFVAVWTLSSLAQRLRGDEELREQVVEQILASLDNTNPEAREYAVGALAAIKDAVFGKLPEMFLDKVVALLRDESLSVRLAALGLLHGLQALGSNSEARSIVDEWFGEQLSSNDPRLVAISRMRELADISAKQLGSNDPTLVALALYALGDLRASEHLAAVEEASAQEQREPEVHAAAMYALAAMRAADAHLPLPVGDAQR